VVESKRFFFELRSSGEGGGHNALFAPARPVVGNFLPIRDVLFCFCSGEVYLTGKEGGEKEPTTRLSTGRKVHSGLELLIISYLKTLTWLNEGVDASHMTR